MTTVSHLRLRAARDRLIDLLGIGQTYPLPDLTVRQGQLTVAFNTTAKIPIEDSQPDVLYQLHYKQELVKRISTGDPIQAQGNGDRMLLETNPIQEDITFEIYAQKLRSGRSVYLHQTATVKVGLDTALKAWILNVPHLDPAGGNPTDAAPRLIDYRTKVAVEIERSQEGVDYDLVHFEQGENGQVLQVLSPEVEGKRDDIITLTTTQPILEDTDLRIRASKKFAPSENRPTQTALLDVILPLRVRANPELVVSVDPGPILDFNQGAKIKIAQTQKSVTYQLYLCPIPDRDFIRRSVPEAEVIKVSVEGEPEVQVPKPPWVHSWTLPAGYVAPGEAQPGSGGELQLQLSPLTRDSLVIVQAQKAHRVTLEPQASLLPSAVQLKQATAVLVRPNPAPPLRLKVWLQAGQTDGRMELFDGQPGIFYHLRLDPDGPDLGLPAYFHRRSEGDETTNKGLGQLVIEVDYVITRPLSSSITGGSPAQTPPPPPLLETGPVSTGVALHIRAVKAQTRVAAPLTQPPQIPDGPDISPEDAIVAYGGKTRIRIKASRTREWYQLWLKGSPLNEPVKGTGQDRLLDTGPLTEDAALELLVRQPDEPIGVERVLPVLVLVRPNPTLQASPTAAVIDANSAAQIRISTSQTGVSYQLLADGNLVRDPVVGNGNMITLSTGPLSQETTFVIRAARVDRPDIFVDLDQQITVQVRPDNPPA